MRYAAFIILTAIILLCGCKTHKQTHTDYAATVDSVAISNTVKTKHYIDSLVKNIDFSFDTLKINIERQIYSNDSCSQNVGITVVNGRFRESNSAHSDVEECVNRLDSVAYNKRADTHSSTRSDSSVIYSPPNLTIVLIVALVIAAIMICFIWVRRCH